MTDPKDPDSPPPGPRHLGGAGRVIFVNRVYWPAEAATAQLLTDLAEGLAARGWTVHVIAAGETAGTRHGVTIHRTGEGEQHAGLISRLGNYWRFIRGAREQLSRVVQPGDVVVAMTDPPLLGTTLADTAISRGARLVHWIQDIYPEIAIAHLGAWSAVPLATFTLKRNAAWLAADYCVVLGEDMARTVTGQGVSAGRVTCVPNWAPRELAAAAPAAAIAAQRDAWGLADRFIVAYSGNLGRVHEFAAVVAAAELLRDRAQIVFLFIGTGTRFAEVQAAARRQNLENISFLPPVPRAELAVSLAAADVQLVTLQPAYAGLVYPSKLAGVLAAGRPVIFIGPPDSEIARLVTREKIGVAVSPTDSPGLAEAITGWQADPENRAQLGRQARAVYEADFSFEKALTRWEAILRGSAAAKQGAFKPGLSS